MKAESRKQKAEKPRTKTPRELTVEHLESVIREREAKIEEDQDAIYTRREKLNRLKSEYRGQWLLCQWERKIEQPEGAACG